MTSDADSRLLLVLTDLILPLIVGYWLQRKHILSDKAANRLIKINIIGVYTLLTWLSFWVIPISWELLIMIPYGILYIIVPGIISVLTFARFYKNPLNRGSYIISSMVANIGTLGGICAYILYQEAGFAYSQILATCQNILLVLVCFPIAQYYRSKHLAHGHETHSTISFREMFLSPNQLSILGILFGLALNISGVERPVIFGELFTSLVHIGAWTALLPVGFLINFAHMKRYYNRFWDLTAMRFIIMPLLVYGTAHYFFTDSVLLNTLLICSTAPTAINAVLTARLYKLNVNLPITSFFVTTVLFLVVVFPTLFMLMR